MHLVARNRDARPLLEKLPECTVHRMRPWPLPAGLNAASMFPAFFNPRWFANIRATASRTGARLIMVRDLPLAPTAILVGRTLGLPVLFDNAENYPAMMRALFENGSQKPFDRLVRNPRAVAAIERWTIRRVDGMLVVIEEARDRLIRLGTPPSRVVIVSNTPPLRRLSENPEPRLSTREPLTLVYLGLMEAQRGIETVLRAVALCRTRGLATRLVLIGDGRDRARFEQLAQSLGLTATEVEFRGRVDNQVALGILREADLGLVPHHADEGWNNTIPNKLFDYMAVVASNARPVERIVNASGSGRIFLDRDPESLATTLQSLVDPAVRLQCALAGRKAIAERFNWEADTRRLLDAVDATAQSSGARR